MFSLGFRSGVCCLMGLLSNYCPLIGQLPSMWNGYCALIGQRAGMSHETFVISPDLFIIISSTAQWKCVSNRNINQDHTLTITSSCITINSNLEECRNEFHKKMFSSQAFLVEIYPLINTLKLTMLGYKSGFSFLQSYNWSFKSVSMGALH